jgi:hypothetical protein
MPGPYFHQMRAAESNIGVALSGCCQWQSGQVRFKFMQYDPSPMMPAGAAHATGHWARARARRQRERQERDGARDPAAGKLLPPAEASPGR